MRRSILFLSISLFGTLFLLATGNAADILPGTSSLDWPEEDLSGRMMDGAHQFVERKITEAVRDRGKFWSYDSPDYAKKKEENRERLREIIGAVNPRLPVRMER